ncbi:YesL family protein [Bifidobacterium sp.]|uniref:YesL family protein n=1 Tax=Bifidobacterium sp. TaxID=41200 RepID=UPI0025BB4D2E|nr:YesL family protein [Bifidobacterium sp.]MCH4209795.1 DUF624 domain-containing protein [Bifidobacterium sp.]MCI1224586.1 DUF624 domain-containing protein [Bifidobacterium sp.]
MAKSFNQRFFNQDNAFFRFMGVGFDLIELNVLTLVCCLPVVSAGASITAMHAVLWRMVRNEETYIARQFFDAFRRNFKQSMAAWLPMLAIGLVMAVDILMLGSLPASLHTIMVVVLTVVGLLVAACAQYLFALISRYRNPLGIQLKNAALLAIGFFPRTVGMLAILVVFALLSVRYFLYAIPLLIMFGVSLPQYCCAWLYEPIFRRIDQQQDR